MDKCRAIHRDRMRAARPPLLASLDIEYQTYQRANEAGDAAHKQAVAARKQTLRDVTKIPEIEQATTPDDLKAVWPQVLTSAATGSSELVNTPPGSMIAARTVDS